MFNVALKMLLVQRIYKFLTPSWPPFIICKLGFIYLEQRLCNTKTLNIEIHGTPQRKNPPCWILKSIILNYDPPSNPSYWIMIHRPIHHIKLWSTVQSIILNYDPPSNPSYWILIHRPIHNIEFWSTVQSIILNSDPPSNP